MRTIILKSINENLSAFCKINDEIWNFAELKFKEYNSSELQIRTLSAEGMNIKQGLCGIETAFCAEYGSGFPVIAILGEFDALPMLSQVSDSLEKQELEKEAAGHGCGHNTLGAAAMLAVVAVKDFLECSGLPGTVRYYGCPAEEDGAGKAFLARDGAFDDVDVALTWHPSDVNAVMKTGSLANVRVFYKFLGISSHAAASPHLGRSALDAVELMNIGANFLREHMPTDARIHYAITNAGGTAPNVVQKEAEVLYAVRTPKVSQLSELIQRVDDIAKGAALMTGTTFERRLVSGYSDFVSNKTLASVLKQSLESVLPEYTDEELAYASGFKKTVQHSVIEKRAEQFDDYPEHAEEVLNSPMATLLYPSMPMFGSTDVGDVSHVVPTAQFYVACYAIGTPSHSWQTVAQGKSALAHKGLKTAASTIALAACELFKNPAIVEKSLEEHKSCGIKYESPIPKDVIAGNW